MEQLLKSIDDMEVAYETASISLRWDYGGERLSIYDSDNEFVDDLFYSENVENPEEEAQYWVNFFACEATTEDEIATFCISRFPKAKVVPNCDKTKVLQLRKQYGSEFVNRIGSTCVVIIDA